MWVAIAYAVRDLEAADEPLADQVRTSCDALERAGAQDWQVRQAEQAVRIYFVHYLQRTDWHQTAASVVPDSSGTVNRLAAFEQLRLRLRTRHHSYRTECAYADWVKRSFDYVSERQGGSQPRVDAGVVRDFATHLAVHRQVSANTQNQALSAVLFLCREVLGLEVEHLALASRGKRSTHLPVVLSLPETAALLDAMHGTSRVMALLIYGGGLRVSECCQLRIKDLDFDQGLVFVRAGKAAKDRATLLPETGGHAHVETTMLYTHVVKELRTPARSPLDLLRAHSSDPTRKRPDDEYRSGGRDHRSAAPYHRSPGTVWQGGAAPRVESRRGSSSPDDGGYRLCRQRRRPGDILETRGASS